VLFGLSPWSLFWAVAYRRRDPPVCILVVLPTRMLVAIAGLIELAGLLGHGTRAGVFE